MTNFNFTRVFIAAAAAAAMTVAVSDTASAHGGGMGGSHMGGSHMGGSHMGGMTSHTTPSTVNLNMNKSATLHNGRRHFRFIRFGVINTASVCVYRWTHLGRRVLVCPDQDY